jgi:hypothetical protein
MDVKHKTCDIRTWKKHLFLDISSINIDKFDPLLYQCVETRSIEVSWLLSQPLPHLGFNLFVISETFATQLWKALLDKHFPSLIETFLYEYPLHWVRLPTKKKRTTEGCSSVVDSLGTIVILTTETSLWTCDCKCFLDSHGAGLCCYLVIQIENLLRRLQLFYFHLWPICWLSLVDIMSPFNGLKLGFCCNLFYLLLPIFRLWSW